MCKFTDYTDVSLGLFHVLNFNGEGADTTICDIDGVCVSAERLSDTSASGKTEWIFEATYVNDVRAEFDKTDAVIIIRKNVLVFNFNEFVFNLTQFVNEINSTTIATRLGLFALKTDGITREDVRSSLFVDYRITQ